MGFLKSLFGDSSAREIKKIQPLVDQILGLESEMAALSDDALRAKTEEFKKRISNGEAVDDLLVEAFAVVREAAWRTLGMKHYPVQLMGGIILHQGRIAEMKTGEGKTLVATLPAYLNALAGKGVHIVTVNDYLASRDKEWMGKVYEFLGMKVGCIIYGLTTKERQDAYNADITYGTNNQFGFDYLRDNMVLYESEKVQRDLYYAIVDEVDSILIDEARTPLIISGAGDDSTDLYMRADAFVKGLTGRTLDPEESETSDPFDRTMKVETVDYIVDEKKRTASLTEQGTEKAERYFGVENFSDPENMELAHHVNQALKARYTMHRDINYVVKDDEVLIVDEFTGRIMQGRRYSDGLHQAIEAKEHVTVKSESKTLATITFQNYFRMFRKLAGMTGTAKTEENEFREIYNMDVVEIPTNRLVIREDANDEIYYDTDDKFRAVVEEIIRRHETGQPILVGTITIENSEKLSSMLKRRGIKHQVLNAKFHEKEAEIIAQAGRLGSVTIATNMAGRGTDIILGGNPDFLARHDMRAKQYAPEIIEQLDSFLPTEDPDILAAREVYKKLYNQYKEETDAEAKKVVETGGLYILGTERHESRRIDNQLRGRSGRQGDPGASKFFISLSDDLMRLFGGETVQKFMGSDYEDDGEPIKAKVFSSVIERAQKRVEANNFALRKHVLQYDDVMNKQRNVIYEERRRVLEGENMKDDILRMIENVFTQGIAFYTQDEAHPDYEGLMNFLSTLHLDLSRIDESKMKGASRAELTQYFIDYAKAFYADKEKKITPAVLRELERMLVLRVVDTKWMDHIDAMDQLRQGIGLRAYGHEDPVRAYANEGYDMFEEMNAAIQEDVVRWLFALTPETDTTRKRVAREVSNADKDRATEQKTVVKGKRIGRNDPCPCGSGKKYKKCCGKNL